jgi:hypothetical protein
MEYRSKKLNAINQIIKSCRGTGWRAKSNVARQRGHKQHQGHGRRRSVSPDVLVDVHIAGTLVGTIEAREGDIAQDLALQFVNKHGLSQDHVPRLAMLVCERLDELFEQEAEGARVSNLEKLGWAAHKPRVGGALPSWNPPHQHHTSEVVTGGESHRLEGSIGNVIGRVRIQLPHNKAGVMTVCEGDDVGALARRFCVSHGLTLSQAEEIKERVLQQMSVGGRHIKATPPAGM